MLYIMDACTLAPLFRGADGPNCKDIINGIAFSMPSCLCHMDDTAIFLVLVLNSRFFIQNKRFHRAQLPRIQGYKKSSFFSKSKIVFCLFLWFYCVFLALLFFWGVIT